MQFQIPQFVDREAKVVGPFTFKQFIFLAIAGAGLFILYFSTPIYVFIIGVIVVGGGALALAMVKIGGRSLPVYIKNFFAHLIAPKKYLWKKKTMPPKLISQKSVQEEKSEQDEGLTPSLKVAERGHLQNLSTQVETRMK